MRQATLGILILSLLVILLPLIIVKCTYTVPQGINKKAQELLSGEGKIKVYIKKQDKVEDIELEQYLKGVVAAEMPAGFPLEALKSQAVAARTYIANRVINSGDVPEHKGANVCTDPTHCNAWISKEDAFKNWGENAENNWKKISDAVDGTQSEIIVYDNKPISALFFSISSGKTEDVKDVWGKPVPYLKSVDSSDDKGANGYASQAEFTADDFKQKIQKLYPECKLEGDIKAWIGQTLRSPVGGVREICIGGKYISGLDARKALDLRSHNFNFKIDNDKFIFNVVGHGHGVGMSQWGARFMADKGSGYKDILNKYYTNISIVKIEKE